MTLADAPFTDLRVEHPANGKAYAEWPWWWSHKAFTIWANPDRTAYIIVEETEHPRSWYGTTTEPICPLAAQCVLTELLSRYHGGNDADASQAVQTVA